jgi:predicted porin
MKSVFKLSCSRLALLAAFGLTISFGPASAADLGGDCCADLEERIAELEATTARKGNRKVSLTISGWVNEGLTWFDDGHTSNVYVGTNDLEQSRVRFVGEARIAHGYSAGYTLELGIDEAGSKGFNQDTDILTQGITLRKSNWWLKSDDLGKVTVGQEGTATYHVLDDANITNTRNFSDAEADGVYFGGFFVNTDHSLKFSDVMRGFNNNTPGQDGRRNIVRYDSPTIAGFTAAAAWGSDDLWDMSLTYQGDWQGFKVTGKAGYGQSNDPVKDPAGVNGGTACGGGVTAKGSDFECSWWGAAGTIMHAPTGLYVYGGYGSQTTDTDLLAGLDRTSTTWFIQPGIEQKWIPLGKTTIYGQYRHDDAGANPSKTLGADLTFWSAGVVQNIEPAAMDLYLMYRHAEGTYQTGSADSPTNNDINNFDMVIGGALIKF